MAIHEILVDLIGRSNPTILEIGANDGQDSKIFANNFKFGNVICFEPDPRAIRRFQANQDNPRISLIEKAVGRKTGRIKFYQSSGRPPGTTEDFANNLWPSDWDLSGSIRQPKLHLEVHPWCKFETFVEVDVVSLDDWCTQNKIVAPDLIWADVQGAEEDLILGGLDTINQCRYFYTEYASQELYDRSAKLQDIVNLLPNFSVVKVFENDVLLKNSAKKSDL